MEGILNLYDLRKSMHNVPISKARKLGFFFWVRYDKATNRYGGHSAKGRPEIPNRN